MIIDDAWYYEGTDDPVMPAMQVMPQVPVSPYGPTAPAVLPCPLFAVRPAAAAVVRGGPPAPQIYGVVYFRDVPGGTEVCADITGLPEYKAAANGKSPVGPHGFHIHTMGNCEVGDAAEPFKAAGEHWNPTNQPHGNHAGDFPVLFSNGGRARMCFFTDKFKPADVVGKSVIIHENPDDYRTQPAGNSGRRLACGVIQRVR